MHRKSNMTMFPKTKSLVVNDFIICCIVLHCIVLYMNMFILVQPKKRKESGRHKYAVQACLTMLGTV